MVRIYTLTEDKMGMIFSLRRKYIANETMEKPRNQRSMPADYLWTISCNKCDATIPEGERVVSRKRNSTNYNTAYYHLDCAIRLKIVAPYEVNNRNHKKK